MAYGLGVLLFALGILISVSLHEAGHMATAKAFGMKVTRYFIGFGPTLWSFRKGETEYGVKAIPAGGFVKIVGMTPMEDEEEAGPEDKDRVFWRKPLWQRTVVLAAGSATHFLLGFLLLWFTVVFVGAQNPAYAKAYDEAPKHTVVNVLPCVVVANENRDCRPSDPVSPAHRAGLRDGDRITKINSTTVTDYQQMVAAIHALPPGSQAVITYERNGVSAQTPVLLAAVQRPSDKNPRQIVTVSALGVSAYIDPSIPATVTYGPVEGIGAAGSTAGRIFTGTFAAIGQFPAKIPKLIDSLGGGQRDQNTPMSVVGASRLGGEVVSHGVWPVFFGFLASLNIFVGIFNLFPLLPLDGGHIAVAWFERARSWWYTRRGRPDPGRVDYLKLMPITYAVIILFGGLTLLTVAADIVNPIQLFK